MRIVRRMRRCEQALEITVLSQRQSGPSCWTRLPRGSIVVPFFGPYLELESFKVIPKRSSSHHLPSPKLWTRIFGNPTWCCAIFIAQKLDDIDVTFCGTRGQVLALSKGPWRVPQGFPRNFASEGSDFGGLGGPETPKPLNYGIYLKLK